MDFKSQTPSTYRCCIKTSEILPSTVKYVLFLVFFTIVSKVKVLSDFSLIEFINTAEFQEITHKPLVQDLTAFPRWSPAL